MKPPSNAPVKKVLNDDELQAYVDYFNVLIEIERGLTDEQRLAIFGGENTNNSQK
jgi:hypothetical protein